MKSFVVIGLGRFGTSVAIELYQLGNEVLAIDKDEERVQEIANQVTQAVIADVEDEGTLRQLGVSGFDCGIVAVASSMEDSVMATMLLKELGVRHVVSKAQSEIHGKVLSKVGADSIVLPERDMGVRVANNLSYTNIIDFLELSPDYGIVEVPIPASWIDKTLIQINVRAKYNVNVLAIKRDGSIKVYPAAEDVFLSGDTILAMGTNESLAKLSNLNGI